MKPLIERAAKTAGFTGKAMATLDLIAPAGTELDRLVVLGTGKASELKETDWSRLGGTAFAALGKAEAATVALDLAGGEAVGADAAADFALGMRLRAYAFDKYKKSKDDGEGKKPVAVTIAVAEPTKAKSAWTARAAIADGVELARDLVNEPANVLGPVEFADRAKDLSKLGLAIEIMAEKDLRKQEMGALLGVAQGSVRPPRVVVMRWNGGKAKDQPLCFIGKGVVFDTGGISIKPAAGMEDMKGDMGGAAAVTGLMCALAGRKAKVNAVGIIGLVENMPDGAAQRPGDIVTARAGKTIEVINTDAEGRLVLADLVSYAEDRFKPRFMIDLATLTGAVIIALGHNYAGMFSSDDELATALSAAGEATGELVWRMPLGAEYDKLLDSKFADMKNIGGRAAGSITGAQFIKRFVKDTPWVHLDIAGTAMGSPQTETNRSWASGWGVRLLDRLVSDRYER
ncbi:MAG: leucyl aminopeptidase [Rhizobiales bacterium]|nr:leucyl aminopeptidase [Hyphomicrobiales bacterium]